MSDSLTSKFELFCLLAVQKTPEFVFVIYRIRRPYTRIYEIVFRRFPGSPRYKINKDITVKFL